MLIEKIIEVESRVPGFLVVHIPRGKVFEDVLGLEDTFSSPWPWPRSLKSSKIAMSLARGQHYFLSG